MVPKNPQERKNHASTQLAVAAARPAEATARISCLSSLIAPAFMPIPSRRTAPQSDKPTSQDLGIIADDRRVRHGACELASTSWLRYLAPARHVFLDPDFCRSTFGRNPAYRDHVARLD